MSLHCYKRHTNPNNTMTFILLPRPPLSTAIAVALIAILLLENHMVDARTHVAPDDTSKKAGQGCCSKDYKTCASTVTRRRRKKDNNNTPWFCNVVDPETNEPSHCGKVGGCHDMVWLPNNVFDFQCVGYRSGTCSPNHSEHACCHVDGIPAQDQLVCDDLTLTCLLPAEIAARSIQHVVPSSELNTPGWEAETNPKAKGCCSHDHKTCDITGYCNWKERCGRFVDDIAVVTITEELESPFAEKIKVEEETNKNNQRQLELERQYKDDHCKQYIWLNDLGRAYSEGDNSSSQREQIINDPQGYSNVPYHPQLEGVLCLAREADECQADAECCPGLYCHKHESDRGPGYSHCAWDSNQMAI